VAAPQDVDLIVMANNGGTPYWRSTRGSLSGDTLEFTGASWGNRNSLRWKDANSGTFTAQVINPTAKDNGRMYTTSFTRLDG
jgi:hypothetical protein